MTRHLLCLAILFSASQALVAQTFVGPGPDQACGGSELRVVQRGERITYMEHTIFQSFRTIVEQYRPNKNGDWKITPLFYFSRWQRNEPLTKQRLARKLSFHASDRREAVRHEKELGYEGMVWQKEPKRLVDYFRANPGEFEKQS